MDTFSSPASCWVKWYNHHSTPVALNINLLKRQMDHGEEDKKCIFYEANMHKQICEGQRVTEHTHRIVSKTLK